MANIKNFSDFQGVSVELYGIHQMDNKVFASRFPNVKGMKADGYTKWVGHSVDTKEVLPVMRKIAYKSNPSKHICNVKCVNGKHNGTCECQCGGKNHGSGGMFTNLIKK